ncbi:MAG TPA: RluA family pseudouridine synthase [Isosphaeraceae bacterium]|nr:RluA family pseudouridine synthase [Isosphaeraceae bacterium]
MRLDKLASQRFGLSRRAAQEAVRRGQVDVAGQTCFEPGQVVAPDTPLEYHPSRPRPGTAARQIAVLYQDRSILIVDKPAGLLTQPTPAREPDTLLERAGRYLARTRGRARPYVGIVHRLDRDTSGVILLVCSPQALRPFQALFRAHAIERRYLAVVEGALRPERGTIELPLVADRGDGRRGVAPTAGQGVRAVTHYEVVEHFGALASLVACRLETGRTHQIRIHLAAVGHPVVSDPVYRPASRRPFPAPFSRQALHAEALGFIHPITGIGLRVEAPVPANLADWIAAVRVRFGR